MVRKIIKNINAFLSNVGKYGASKIAPFIVDKATQFTQFLQKKGLDPVKEIVDDVVLAGLQKIIELSQGVTSKTLIKDMEKIAENLVETGGEYVMNELVQKDLKKAVEKIEEKPKRKPRKRVMKPVI